MVSTPRIIFLCESLSLPIGIYILMWKPRYFRTFYSYDEYFRTPAESEPPRVLKPLKFDNNIFSKGCTNSIHGI